MNMKRNRNILCVGLVVMFAAVSFSVAAKQVKQLERFRGIYEKKLDEIKTDHNRKIQALPAIYIKALKALQKNMQKRGNLTGWVAVKKELSRFETDRAVSEEALVTIPKELKDLQAGYRKRTKKYSMEEVNGIILLSRTYLRSLRGMQEALTIEGAVDDALAVNSEIERVKASPELAAADFQIAEQEASKELVESVGREEEPDEGGEKDEPAVVTTSRYKIYRRQKPPAIPGMRFKKLMLRVTPHVRTGRKVSINAMLATDEDIATSNRGISYWSSYRSESGTVSHFLRLSVRSKSKALVLKNPTVVVQYFSKRAGKSSGKLRPEKLSTEHIELARLTSDWVHIDLSPVLTFKSTYRYSSRVSQHRSASGKEFYGVIISVFDGGGTLVAQGASTSKLIALAGAEPIEKSSTKEVEDAYRKAKDVYDAAKAIYYRAPDNKGLEDSYRKASRDFFKARRHYEEATGIEPD